MLRYLNQGMRTVRSAAFKHPLGLKRGNWEFFAVVSGTVRPIDPEKSAGVFQTRRLWMLPPESAHTWSLPPGKGCRVFVFHFSGIHPLLEKSLPASRRLSIPLDEADVRFLRALYAELLPHYRSPRLASAVHFEAAMLRLCARFLDRNREVSALPAFDTGAEKVLQAIQWHREHFAEGVRVNRVAAALHLSAGHLRRLFLKVRGETPKRVFMRATMEEACRLMASGELSFKEVASRCGFSGFSEFYRAFKKEVGQSPSTWRANRLYRGLGIKTAQ
jgi:AraC-like DNA-binding protein